MYIPLQITQPLVYLNWRTRLVMVLGHHLSKIRKKKVMDGLSERNKITFIFSINVVLREYILNHLIKYSSYQKK